MRSLPGYEVSTQIDESANSLVYRGVRELDREPVIIKRLKQDYPTQEQLTRYKQEYEITSNLLLEGVIKAYDLLPYQKTLAIILEDFGGESLQLHISKIDRNRAYFANVEEFLTIAISLAGTLSQIHAANIIHKDINPSNIVYHEKTGEIKIIDFGISTAFSRENLTIKHPNVLEGTLAYISPEQTGRMNRSLDYRTDFYSLGVTFYQLLTNQLPFNTTDPLELVHCHLAKQPVPPHKLNPNIPEYLSAIVMKLMAKTAEERYQSAYGLQADLKSCLLSISSRPVNFSLGTQDICDKFRIPQKLYGREAEVETLLKAFTNTSQGATEMMLVAGYSGIGKSTLVQEIYKPITKQRGYFIAGKFDQFRRNIPYSAVVKALRSLIKQLLTESEVQLQEWKSKILKAVGENGQVIIDVITELELVIGKQPPIQELPPAEAQNRFNVVFLNFIRVFCQKQHPLVLFLDDLQWADSATLKLIELIMRDEKLGHLLLIGAYRDNEVNPTHPTIITIEGLKASGAVINDIILTPLNLEHISQLISDTLKTEINSVAPLTNLIFGKTGGNPFFVNQFLKTLYQENLINFDSESLKWQWDIVQIEAMDITDNVVDLMIDKLRKLPEATQAAIRLSACIGNTFDLTTLAIILEKSESESYSDIIPAIQSGLILPISELETTGDDLINSSILIKNYKFLHDRVQQAAYALIDENKKRTVHLQIGQLLLHHIDKDELTTRIFEVVDHLNLSRELIIDEEKRRELVSLNLLAGRKAKEATAYAAANSYLTVGMDVFLDQFWSSDYELALALFKERAEVEYLNGNFQTLLSLVNKTLERVQSPVERGDLYNLLILMYTMTAKYSDAVKVSRQALAELGIVLPEDGLQIALDIELSEYKRNLDSRGIICLIEEPQMTVPEKRVAAKLLINTTAACYSPNYPLWKVIIAKLVNLFLCYGHISESSAAYSAFGVICGEVLNDYQAGYEFGLLALKISEKFNNLSYQCIACNFVASHLIFWIKHIKYAYDVNNQGYLAGLEIGNLQWVGYIFSHTLLNQYFQGRNLKYLLEESNKYLQFSEKTKNQWAIDAILGAHLVLRNLNGVTSGKFDFDSETKSEVEFLQECEQQPIANGIFVFQRLKAQTLYLYGQYFEALKCILLADKTQNSIPHSISIPEQNFFYSLIITAIYPTLSLAEQKIYWQQLELNQQQMKLWANECPDNFLHKYLLVAAEMLRLSGDFLQAIALYESAIKSAQEHDFIQHEALANELAAKFWLNQGNEKVATIYMQSAKYCYEIWGASYKVKELLESYPHLFQNTDTGLKSKSTMTKSVTTTNNCPLDLASVLKASQAISQEIVLSELLKKIMLIVMENAGASNGYLILKRANELVLEVAVDTEGKIAIATQALVDSSCLPLSIINYVIRTQENVVLADATKEHNFASDPYIQYQKPKSVLATNIIYQTKLIGILYLENNLTTGAFTDERLEILKVLTSQAAISLENAMLYNTLEQKVVERTQELTQRTSELSQTLADLKATQKKLVESEKMAALGSLVAGVAHEINTPVGTSITVASTLATETTSFVQSVEKGNLKKSILQNYIDTIQESVSLIMSNLQRAGDLVKSFKQVAVDQSSLEKRTFAVKDYIEEVLVSLAPQLRQTKHNLTVEGDETVIITSYPGALAQIIANFVLNSLTHAYPPGSSGNLRFDVRKQGEQAIVQYSDDGCGIPEEHLEKIFDPFFTTARNIGGTGLGLHIVYNLVNQKMQGTIEVKSQPRKGTIFTIIVPPSTR